MIEPSEDPQVRAKRQRALREMTRIGEEMEAVMIEPSEAVDGARERLRRMAQRWLSSEIDGEDGDGADWMESHDWFVEESRALLDVLDPLLAERDAALNRVKALEEALSKQADYERGYSDALEAVEADFPQFGLARRNALKDASHDES